MRVVYRVLAETIVEGRFLQQGKFTNKKKAMELVRELKDKAPHINVKIERVRTDEIYKSWED